VPKYNVSINFSLTTEIEPEGIRFDRDIGGGTYDISDVEDNSYWQRTDVTSDGGDVTFTITCDSEDEAQAAAEEAVYDGQEFTDDSGFAWLATDVSYEIEKVIVPMTMEFATELLKKFLSEMEGMDEEYEEAFRFLLDQIGTLPTLAERDAEIRRLQAEVTRLGGLLTAIQVAQAESEAPEEIVTT